MTPSPHEARSVRRKGERYIGSISPNALRRLKRAVDRSKRTGVPFVNEFLSRTNLGDPSPPLARMLRGGRGGEVRLKLYLTICLMAVKDPHAVSVAPDIWAEMLGLPEYESKGARRIRGAIKWLEKANLVHVERKSGMHPNVFLLSQSGSGQDYRRPMRKGERYTKLDVAFWENGWILAMSAPAVAVLLILSYLQWKKRAGDLTWIRAHSSYDISPDTWARGTKLLSHLGLLTVTRGVRGDDLEWRRLRNLYWVNLEGLMEEAQNRNVGR